MTAGAGHRRAAEALAQAAKSRWPQATVECLDVLTCAPSWFRAGYAWSYLFLVRHLSWIWKFSYCALDAGSFYRLVQPLRRAWNAFIVRAFVEQLKADPPDMILTTHFLPTNVCATGKAAGWLSAPLVVVVTDLHPHWFWVEPASDAVVVATPESARVCEQRGIAPGKIHVLGIPIGAAFTFTPDRDALRTQLGVMPNRQTILVTSGGTTIGHFELVVESLIALEQEMPSQLQLLVVCGEDAGARERLLKRAHTSPMPLNVFGFIDNMAELMAVSDLAVAKAGGLTVSEALGRTLPLVLYHIIPGQEQMNAQYLADHGAGLIAHGAHEVAQTVRDCIRDPQRLARMREAAKQLSHPHAADEIMAQVVQPLLESVVHSP